MDLQGFEHRIASLAVQCRYDYGGMGVTGFLYASVKDVLEWAGESVRHLTPLLCDIGALLVMDDKQFAKTMARRSRSEGSREDKTAEMMRAIAAAFGTGKKEQHGKSRQPHN